ncbi:MAG TPA: ribose-5-phosphate isomerase RpiA [Devosia sp.]|nr:ribose-5-phosphate isomerase RpiA [Devosia sp.]
MSETLKRQAAEAAIAEIRQDMRIGLGTGSTASHFVDLLGERVAQGLRCLCVPTSEQTARQAAKLNIPLSDLDHLERLDLTVDGTDEIDAQMSLIKGGGGALLREKIVAAASDRLIVVADQSKLVPALGAFPLPIEVNAFGLGATRHAIFGVMKRLGQSDQIELRKSEQGADFLTDGGHKILDAFFGRICDARALSRALLDIPGVVQHGLFLDMCDTAYLAGPDGVTKHQI